MNEDIKQLIEKECEAQKDIHWNDFGERADAASRLFDEAFAKGFNSCLSKWQEAERWRKVEEELPKVKDEDYFILCKTSLSQRYSIVLVHAELDFKRYFRVMEITHWKPIND